MSIGNKMKITAVKLGVLKKKSNITLLVEYKSIRNFKRKLIGNPS